MSVVSQRPRLRPVLWGLAALALIAVIGWKAGAWGPSSTETASDGVAAADADVRSGLALYPEGKRPTAPALVGTTLDGDTFDLSDLRGKVIVLNVWGSWCGPCRAETPDLVRLARADAGRGVRFVGINTRDDPAAARAFAASYKVPYPSVMDDNGRLLLNFRKIIPSAVVPSSVVIDRTGHVAARIIGRVTYRTLQGVLDDELGIARDRTGRAATSGSGGS